MYTQGDGRWGNLLLGASSCTCAQYGCLATDFAIALTLSGWNVTPYDFITKMNAIGGFTNQGLLIWAKAEEAYPQIHLSQGNEYTFQEGTMGLYTHFVLKTNGTVYDPLWGQNSEPTGFHETTYHPTATIDKAPVVAETTAAIVTPTHFEPFVTDLYPSQTFSAEVVRVQQFLQSQGCLGVLPASNYGYYGPKTEAAVKAFISKYPDPLHPAGINWDYVPRGIANGIIQSTNTLA